MSERKTPAWALQTLQEGNARFASGKPRSDLRLFDPALASGQKPFAVILGCSDARTPPDLVFDQGLGCLFVVRVAGNIVAPSLIGSVEFACSMFGVSLVVVLGHTRCGAIQATADVLAGNNPLSENIRSITNFIAPGIADVLKANVGDPEQVLRDAMRANVRASVEHMAHGSPILEKLVREGKLAMVGAEFELETGRVNFNF